MFGRHDDNTQDDQDISAADDSILANLPMPDSNEPMVIESPDGTTSTSLTASSTTPSFRQDTTTDSPAAPVVTTPAPTATPAATDMASDDLMSIKQDALQQLKPLVGHLEQTAEEKFRTTMMMIQASDDQSLIPTAYAAAKTIADDKVRAQALLDVVNEINYFTTQQANQAV